MSEPRSPPPPSRRDHRIAPPYRPSAEDEARARTVRDESNRLLSRAVRREQGARRAAAVDAEPPSSSGLAPARGPRLRRLFLRIRELWRALLGRSERG